MLRVSTDDRIDAEVLDDEDDAIFCAGCGAFVTRGRWRISMNGGHEHTYFNPAGHFFCVVCFKEAPGTAVAGNPTDEFTWFRGYLWRFALCRHCGVHLGWQYEGEAAPAVFFGLIKPKLSSTPT